MKRYLAFLLAIMLAVATMGCRGDADKGINSPAGKAKEKPEPPPAEKQEKIDKK